MRLWYHTNIRSKRSWRSVALNICSSWLHQRKKILHARSLVNVCLLFTYQCTSLRVTRAPEPPPRDTFSIAWCASCTKKIAQKENRYLKNTVKSMVSGIVNMHIKTAQIVQSPSDYSYNYQTIPQTPCLWAFTGFTKRGKIK